MGARAEARQASATPGLSPWVDMLAHQAAWWGCVILARGGAPTLATLALAPYLLLHLLRASAPPWATLGLALAGATTGLVADSTLQSAGAIVFTRGDPNALFSPWWMIGLWAALALSTGSSMRWLRRLPLWSLALLGSVAGPIAYSGGRALDVLHLTSLTAYLGVAAAWSIALPLIVKIGGAMDAERSASLPPLPLHGGAR